MAYQLDFEKLLTYDVGEPGISLETTLWLRQESVTLTAKIDTGASCCIFQRQFGEQLGFDIEWNAPSAWHSYGNFLELRP